ncbi:MAG TPA: hypothetical protein VFK05_38185 [Polyangiaceae bacterium]|nr:hypothetical protein [Polyangiaceae bacterium]
MSSRNAPKTWSDRPAVSERAAAIAAFFCGSWLLAGCDSCGSNKPYTPFGVASSLPSVEPPALSVPASASALAPAPPPSAGFAVRKAELVPGAPQNWQGSDLNLSAPSGRRFAQVLPSDFDGDQKPDALAWLVPAPNEKNVAAGELWYFPNGAAAKLIAPLPGFVPSSADCALTTNLTQTGPHSAMLDVMASCTPPLIARSPSRALLVVSPTVEHPVLLTLRAASPAADESLEFSVDSSDQDHDDRDDVRVTVSVGSLGTSSASEPASADLVWLDRTAGASRSASEPAASLLRLAGKIALQARGKRGGGASEHAQTTLRLLSSLCAEGGVPRVFDEDGAPFRCGQLSRVLDSLSMSEALASLAQGDVQSAFAVLRRDGWYFEKLSTTQRKALERELLRAVSKLETLPPFVARAQPLVPSAPHYSPLWFESDGALLIQSAGGMTRIASDRTQESAVSPEGGPPSWPLEFGSASGVRVLGAVHACDRSELLFNEGDANNPLLRSLTTRLLAARPASCSGRGSGPAIAINPLSFDDNGLEALVAGARVSIPAPGKKPAAGLPALGTPRSPDGRFLVTPSPLGLLVIGERKELWQTNKLSEHAAADRFTDCVVANDARAVACIDGGRAIVFERPKPSTTTRK